MERAQIYDLLITESKQLMDKLYGGRDQFIKADIRSPFESFVVEYDRSIGHPIWLVQLAEAIGMAIPPWAEPNIYIYQTLMVYLDILQRAPIGTMPVEEVINMDMSAFAAWMHQRDPYWRISEDDYHRRLGHYIDRIKNASRYKR